ncbi:chorismate mutase [Streptomyces sp. NPDC093252]|uniref:chorismate mutase n=1 Tax=Streptomyces sp. NPDC093252 TaxID=3154980 RepID=UPI003416C256
MTTATSTQQSTPNNAQQSTPQNAQQNTHQGTPHNTPQSTRQGTQKTGAHTAEAADVISGARERIDALDDRIIGLIQERMAVSAVIQDARITSGGRRVNLSREMEILGHYREALGKPGTTLAMTLLELCRGKI